MLGDNSLTWLLYFALWGYYVLEVLATTPDVCSTPECVEASERVKKNMDPSVNPCKDFYRFACGNYLKTEKVDKLKSQKCAFITVHSILEKQIYTLLNNSHNRPNEPKPFKLARNLYNACIREDLMEKRGVDFVVDMVKKIGGWPVLEGKEWDADKFNWVETVYKLHDIGLGAEMFELTVGVDLLSSYKRVIVVDQVGFYISREHLIEGQTNMLVRIYGSYMVDIAIFFGAKHDVAVKELSDALDFEIELAKIALNNVDHRDFSKTYNPMEIEQLQYRHPVVKWKEYITKLFYTANNVTTLKYKEVIVVKVPQYLNKLEALLKKTDKRTIANYLIWKGISGAVGLLTSAMRNRQSLFKHVITGRDEREPRWRDCLRITAGSMSLAVSSMYVRHYFNEEAKENAVEMVENIRIEMLNILKGVDWMDEETRSVAIEKAHAIHKHVAYPNELLDDKKIEEFYEKLEITGEPFFESVVNLTKFFWNLGNGLLREKVNKTDWRTHAYAAVINAFYDFMENSLKLPAAILQDVFFSHDRPSYMNYGAIGFVMAHEITHGFDHMGRQFDKFGNFHIWWKSETVAAYKRRIQCVIDQANNYTVESVYMKINGVNTQGQNAADIGGIKLAYRAYNSWAAKHKTEPRLVGLEKYTPQQMFWLSAANVWCTVYQTEALRLEMGTGHLPPSEYRVNGAMRNQETFAKDFQCPVGSKMNPAEKCNVW